MAIESNLLEGAVRTITADAPAEGYEFDAWTGDVSALADALTNPATVTMPAANVEVTATYKVTGPPPALMHFVSLTPVEGDIYNETGTFVNDPYSLSEWNTFFGLSYDFENEPWTNGPAFTSISVVGNTVDLIGPGGIHLRNDIFYVDSNNNPTWRTKLTKFDDRLGMIISAGVDCFGYATIDDVNLPALVTAGNYCFEFATGPGTLNVPLLTTMGSGCMEYGLARHYRFDSLTEISYANGWGSAIENFESFYLPSLTTIETNAFPVYTYRSSVTVTIPAALMTVNGGNPHPEIQRLIDDCNKPLTIITV